MPLLRTFQFDILIDQMINLTLQIVVFVNHHLQLTTYHFALINLNTIYFCDIILKFFSSCRRILIIVKRYIELWGALGRLILAFNGSGRWIEPSISRHRLLTFMLLRIWTIFIRFSLIRILRLFIFRKHLYSWGKILILGLWGMICLTSSILVFHLLWCLKLALIILKFFELILQSQLIWLRLYLTEILFPKSLIWYACINSSNFLIAADVVTVIRHCNTQTLIKNY